MVGNEDGSSTVTFGAGHNEILGHSSAMLLRACLHMYNALEYEQLNYLSLCSSQHDLDSLHATSHVVDVLIGLVCTCPNAVHQSSCIQDLLHPIFMLKSVLVAMKEVGVASCNLFYKQKEAGNQLIVLRVMQEVQCPTDGVMDARMQERVADGTARNEKRMTASQADII